jgi:hypothetical protein
VKVYNGFEIIPIGRRFEPKRSFLLGVCTNGGNVLCVEGTLFPLGERASPFVEKNPDARATRYDDIPFCMGKQSKTCEIFELNGLFAL